MFEKKANDKKETKKDIEITQDEIVCSPEFGDGCIETIEEEELYNKDDK